MTLCFNGFSQKVQTEGTITYRISFNDSLVSAAEKSLLPTEAFLFYNSSQSRMEVQLGPVLNMVTLADSLSLTMLIDLAGKKMAIRKPVQKSRRGSKSGMILPSAFENDYKVIAGYPCRAMAISLQPSDTLKFWVNDQLKSLGQWNENLAGIDFIPLECDLYTDKFNMHMTALKVELGKPDPGLFLVPPDYQLVDESELKSLFNGHK